MQHARFLTPALCKSLQDFCKGQKRFRPCYAKVVAPQLTVVTNTTVQSSVAVPVSDARAARVVPSVAVVQETTAVRALSSNGR